MAYKSKVERCNKGESLLISVDNYVVVDLETTGLSPFDEEIIEFGAARVIDGEVVETFDSLANPRRRIEPKITRLTGITNDMLSTAPDIAEVLEKFLAFVGDFVIVGHNISYDINFLYDSCMRHGKGCFTNDFIDTLRISRRCAEHLSCHKLNVLSEYYSISNPNAHRALSDVLCTQKLYELFKRYFHAKEFQTESRAFGAYSAEAIYDAIVDMVKPEGEFIKLQKNKTNTVIKFYDTIAFEIRLNTRSAFLLTECSCARPYVDMIPGASINKYVQFVFPIASAPESVPAYRELMLELYRTASGKVSAEHFLCCNDFILCSDERRCTHAEDPDYLGCVYRKNLENGLIFYGKNRNV